MSEKTLELLRKFYKSATPEVQAEIKQAAKEVESLAAQSLEQAELLSQTPLPDAPFSVSLKVVDPDTKFEYLVSIRSHFPTEMISKLKTYGQRLHDAGFIALDEYIDRRRSERAETGQYNQPTGGPGDRQPAQTTAPDGNRTGTGQLLQLTIEDGGKFSFKIDGRQYPLKDSRGAKVVGTLFATDCWLDGFTPEMLEEPGIFTPKRFGTLYVDWVKKAESKYYDVVSIHR